MNILTVLTFSVLSFSAVIANAQSASGVVSSVACLGEEVPTESAKSIALKGQKVSIAQIKSLVQNADGSIKSGMGIMEDSKKIAIVITGENLCLKSKTAVSTLVITVLK